MAACSLLVLAFFPTGTTTAHGADAAIGRVSDPSDLLKGEYPNTTTTDAEIASAAEDTANQEHVTATATLTPKGALWRSALVPGWGQLRNGRYFKAVLFFTAAAGFAGATISETRNLDLAEAAERPSTAGRRNTRLLLFIATATFSALDAYVDAHLADFGPSLAGSPDPQVGLSLIWDFQ